PAAGLRFLGILQFIGPIVVGGNADPENAETDGAGPAAKKKVHFGVGHLAQPDARAAKAANRLIRNGKIHRCRSCGEMGGPNRKRRERGYDQYIQPCARYALLPGTRSSSFSWG